MAQEAPQITSTQPGLPSIDLPSKQPTGYAAVALGIALFVSGIFLTLAAHNILPNGMHAISKLGTWGDILGSALIISGSFAAAYGLWKAFSQKDLQKSVSNTAPRVDPQDSAGIAPTANSWKRGPGRGEVEQTLAAFKTSEAMQANAKRNLLNIVIIDEGISTDEREILRIVVDYLEVIHGVTVTLAQNYTLTGENQRGNQYAVEPNISQMITNLHENAFVLGFTSKDLFPYSQRDSTNFIFGIGLWKYAAGLFSTCRVRCNSFETYLIRLMRLASHEFAHMRGLNHCTKYACCMQGANSMDEADQIPLTFCASDMEKICFLNGWSLQEGYQRQLGFFVGFSEKYGKNADFSEGIQHLQRKIETLSR